MGKANSFRIGFVAIGEAVQEGWGSIRRELIDRPVTEFLAKGFDDGQIGPERIFFRMVLVLIGPDGCCYLQFHEEPPVKFMGLDGGLCPLTFNVVCRPPKIYLLFCI